MAANTASRPPGASHHPHHPGGATVDPSPHAAHPPPTEQAGGAHTGFLTVVCVPACDDVLDGRRSLGPSPVFKATLGAGHHRLTLRTSDPPTEKAVDVTVVADETTAIRQRMGD